MISAIIVAAGKGERMGTAQRKQYMDLSGTPILIHSLKPFDQCPLIDQIIVVIPNGEIEFCQKQIVDPADLKTPTLLVPGGKRRQDSVFNGINAVKDNEGIVLIHDGARPLISTEMIEACIQGAHKWGACIPAIAPVDTPKQVDSEGRIVQTISRDSLRFAQTPQAFQLPIIQKAHRQSIDNGWVATDDASLVELMGQEVHIIEGQRENLKITTPEDLLLAEIFLKKRSIRRERS